MGWSIMRRSRIYRMGRAADGDGTQLLRSAVRDLCAHFDGAYWRRLGAARAYPQTFVQALTAAEYLAALIPEEYGGAGLGLVEGCAILEEINRSGGNAGADAHWG